MQARDGEIRDDAPAAGDAQPPRPARPRLTLGELAAILFCGFTLQSAIVLSGYWRPPLLQSLLASWQQLAGPPARPTPRLTASEPPAHASPEAAPAERRMPRRPLRRPPVQKSRLTDSPFRA